jgi:hypothetical protein
MSVRTPRYRLHKPSGLAVVTLSGQDHYLGPYGSLESRAEYDKLVAIWLSNGRTLAAGASGRAPADLTIKEALVPYLRFIDGYYMKNGKPTNESANIRLALKPLKALFGHTVASEFGPRGLKAVRDAMIKADLWKLVDLENTARRDFVDADVACQNRPWRPMPPGALLPNFEVRLHYTLDNQWVLESFVLFGMTKKRNHYKIVTHNYAQDWGEANGYDPKALTPRLRDNTGNVVEALIKIRQFLRDILSRLARFIERETALRSDRPSVALGSPSHGQPRPGEEPCGYVRTSGEARSAGPSLNLAGHLIAHELIGSAPEPESTDAGANAKATPAMSVAPETKSLSRTEAPAAKVTASDPSPLTSAPGHGGTTTRSSQPAPPPDKDRKSTKNRNTLLAEFLRAADPTMTSEEAGRELGIKPQTVRNMPAWKERQVERRVAPDHKSEKTRQLTDQMIRVRPSQESDPAKTVAARDEFEVRKREYIEGLSDKERADFFALDEEKQTERIADLFLPPEET